MRNQEFPRPRCSGQNVPKGVSLLEALVALVLVGFLVFNIWSAYIQSKGILKVSIREMEAMTYGVSFLSQARKFRPSLLVDAGWSPLTPQSIDASGTAVFRVGPGCSFTIQELKKDNFTLDYEIEKVNVSLPTPVKLFSLKVSWQEGGERRREAVFSSLCTE